MLGIFNPGDELKVDLNYYSSHKIQREDHVIVKKKLFPAPIIKSALVLPGDEFYLEGDEFKGAELIVNKKPLQNGIGKVFRFSRQAYKMLKLYEKNFNKKMPENYYFVFGTKGNGSRDSSKFGPVSGEEIIGKVVGKK